MLIQLTVRKTEKFTLILKVIYEINLQCNLFLNQAIPRKIHKKISESKILRFSLYTASALEGLMFVLPLLLEITRETNPKKVHKLFIRYHNFRHHF